MPNAPTARELAGPDAHRHLARLRDRSPVAWVDALGGFVVTGYAEAVAVLRDAPTFTVDDPRFSTARVVGPSMLSTDGADHARHRAPFVAPFARRRVKDRLGALVDAQVERRADALARPGAASAELRAGLAGPVAASVVAGALGLDGDDDIVVRELLSWYRAIVAGVSGVAEGRTVPASAHDAMRSLGAALEATLGAASLLGEVAGAGALTTDEIVSDAALVMFGGIETTESMILNAIWFVLQPGVERPPAEDLDALAAVVEESLRLEPAAAFVDRYATVDAVVGGTSIPAGSFVTVSLAGANRDPVEFPDPDRFDPTRTNRRRQLAFATGPHLCLGMDLARLETVTALGAVLRRWPALRLAPGSPAPTGLVFRKPERLDVTWGPTVGEGR